MASALRILVVDDDEDHARSLAELFEMEGHLPQLAFNGKDAVEAFRSGDFDLAFMDVMMPGMNGVESFLEIRKIRPEARVYMMTGYSVEQLLRQAMDQGAMGVISKPVNTKAILEALDGVEPAGTVLVAENDADFGPLLRDLIRASGRKCELATDGQQALDMAMNGTVGVLILDLKMPLIGGIDVCRRLRQAGRVIPTIIITGNGPDHADTLAAIQDVAVSGILNKPFDPALLIQRLEGLAA
jgi:CheY-like chemotaxis protein